MSIKDVAQLAGVSVSTVSRVVNSGDSSAASSKTQEKIWAAVRAVGYTPNENARSLKVRGKPIIAVQGEVDCVYARSIGNEIDSFFLTLMHAAEVELFSRGYNMRYQYSLSDLMSGKVIRSLSDFSSAIVVGRVDKEDLVFLRKYYKHIVCTGLQLKDIPADQVICSGYDAALTCVRYLGSLGHTRICYFGECDNEQRYLGYADGMREISDDDFSDYVVNVPFTPGGGYVAVHTLLERRHDFTAILCANDMLAVGVLKALREHKLSVPRDVSLIGINDMETVRYLDPMLTSIHIPRDEMGRHAVKLLLDRISGGHTLPVTLKVPYSLIKRESCIAPSSGS